MVGNNMIDRFEKVKTVNDLPESLKNLVQFQVVDGNVEAVTVSVNNESIRIVVNGTYSNNLKVLKAEEKEEKKIYIVSGTISDVEIIPKGFETEYEADEFIAAKGFNSNTDLKKEVRSVFVDKVSL